MAELFEAVVYREQDYVPIGGRLIAMFLDFAVLCLFVSGLTITLLAVEVKRTDVATSRRAVQEQGADRLAMIPEHARQVVRYGVLYGVLAILVGYYIVLRRSRGGTLGYRLTGVRLIDPRGEPPALWYLMKRLILPFVLILPSLIVTMALVTGFDMFLHLSLPVKRIFAFVGIVPPVLMPYLVCLRNPKRQAFHDRWAGTWMVRKASAPLGQQSFGTGRSLSGQ